LPLQNQSMIGSFKQETSPNFPLPFRKTHHN
jgi:hypothetical protein